MVLALPDGLSREVTLTSARQTSGVSTFVPFPVMSLRGQKEKEEEEKMKRL